MPFMVLFLSKQSHPHIFFPLIEIDLVAVQKSLEMQVVATTTENGSFNHQTKGSGRRVL